MKIGVVREIKDQEKRVALTPEGVGKLVGRGHTVMVETRAGRGSGFAKIRTPNPDPLGRR